MFLKRAPTLSKLFVTHPTTRSAFLTSKVEMLHPPDYLGKKKRSPVSLLFASYVVGRPLREHYNYDQTNLLVELMLYTKKKSDQELVVRLLDDHTWTVEQLTSFLLFGVTNIDSEFLNQVIIKLQSIRPARQHSINYTPK